MNRKENNRMILAGVIGLGIAVGGLAALNRKRR